MILWSPHYRENEAKRKEEGETKDESDTKKRTDGAGAVNECAEKRKKCKIKKK